MKFNWTSYKKSIIFFSKCHFKQNFLSKYLFEKMFVQANVLSSSLFEQMFFRANVHSIFLFKLSFISLSSKFLFEQKIFRQMYVRENFRSSQCPLEQMSIRAIVRSSKHLSSKSISKFGTKTQKCYSIIMYPIMLLKCLHSVLFPVSNSFKRAQWHALSGKYYLPFWQRFWNF